MSVDGVAITGLGELFAASVANLAFGLFIGSLGGAAAGIEE
jgi:hypothetical protein